MGLQPNALYFGDNLEWLSQWDDESVDLIYLDPPFNSNTNYNILYSTAGGGQAQVRAFDDTWRWDTAAAERYAVYERASGRPAHQVIVGLYQILGESGMLAYLTYMAERLEHLHRLLKPTGSLYLHCDPTMSHYLKLVLDGIFGADKFRNEIIWKRTPFSGSSKARARQFPRVHDVVLSYSKSDTWTWNQPMMPYTEDYLKRFKWKDERGFYRKTLLKTYSQKTFDRLTSENRIIEPTRKGAKYSYKQYLHESKGGSQVNDMWVDINMINPVAKERLGYPTQKPLALLERIIAASSNPGDIVLDPFAGCGTTVDAAQRLNRQQVGDGGIDGQASLYYEPEDYTRRAVAQVAGSRSFSLSKLRDFLHVTVREQAAIGCYVTLEPVQTPAARREVASAGTVMVDGQPYPRMHLWPVSDYFVPRLPALPLMADGYTGKPVQPVLR